eukprot:6240608-Alexandrium_andersonii.AAC.1
MCCGPFALLRRLPQGRTGGRPGSLLTCQGLLLITTPPCYAKLSNPGDGRRICIALRASIMPKKPRSLLTPSSTGC